MSAKLYRDQACTQEFSNDVQLDPTTGAITVAPTNPIETEHPKNGSVESTILYLADKTLDPAKYEECTFLADDIAGTDEASYVEFAPDNAGSAGTWGSTLVTTLNLSTDVVPIHYRATMPAQAGAVNKGDIKLILRPRLYAKL